jgi:hypothetical protein
VASTKKQKEEDLEAEMRKMRENSEKFKVNATNYPFSSHSLQVFFDEFLSGGNEAKG